MDQHEIAQDYRPLAETMRPQSLDQFVGQSQLVGEGAGLRQALLAGRIHSMVLWGPPGTGKTTLARMVAQYCDARFEVLSAAITLLSGASYAFNTLNDLPDAVATALPILEKGASAFFLAEYLARFYSRGFDARRGPAYIQSSRGLMDKASPS